MENSDLENKLTNVVKEFIKEQKISCAETIYQCDNVIVNSYKFIQNCCEIVGYLNEKE